MNPRFPCDDYLNAVNPAQHPLFSVLWDSSFGKDKECLRRFLATNLYRPHAVLVYMENGNGRNDGTLESGDWFKQVSARDWNKLIEQRSQIVLQAFADRLNAIHEFMAAHGGEQTQVIIVPALEDHYSAKAWKVLGSFIAERTFFLLARNPSTGSREIGAAYFKEKHGDKASCSGLTQIANLDGVTLSKSDTMKWLRSRKDCFVSIAYVPEIQGRHKDGGFVGKRFDRSFRVPKGWDRVLSDF